MIPLTGRSAETAEPTATREDGGIRGVLSGLFPPAPAVTVPSAWGWRLLGVVAQVLAVVAGATVLLLRVPGLPAWDTVYAEDYSEFLLKALQQPWHLFIPYNGYEQLLPRVAAQLVTYLPLAYTAKAFAWCGALTAAACALFVFHASAGHIRSVTLRALLAAAVVLLPSAPMEIADSTVDAPWYLLLAMFWAVLWRPRTRTGMAAATVLGFVTAASTSIVILFAPLLAVRVFALRRVRDHAVTAGWLAGCLVQLPVIVEGAAAGQSRLVGGQVPALARGGQVGNYLPFYLHDAVLRSIGWHLSWWLESRTSEDWATLIVTIVLVVAFGVIMARRPGARPFIVTGLLTGFVFTVVSVFLTPWAAAAPVTFRSEAEARYTALPIFLIEAAFIVGADWLLRGLHERGARRALPVDGQRDAVAVVRPALAVAAVVALLAAGWVADFRYKGMRSAPPAHPWAPVVTDWRHACEISPNGDIGAEVHDGFTTILCDRLRF